MIGQQVVERAAAVLRHEHRTGVIILLDDAVVYFVIVADEDARDASDGLLDPVAVAVVHVTRRDAPGHRRQPVLGVVGQGVALLPIASGVNLHDDLVSELSQAY